MLPALLVLAGLLLPELASAAAGHFSGGRLQLTHVDSRTQYTQVEIIRRALLRDSLRHGRGLLSTSTTPNISTPLHPSNFAAYTMELSIGTPPLPYTAMADTGSDLIWTQCQPCTSCYDQKPTPVFDPRKSSSYSKLPCKSPLSPCRDLPYTPPSCSCAVNITYGIGWNYGTVGTEAFTFGSKPGDGVKIPNLVFLCATASSKDIEGTGIAGLVGLGRGNLSLISQLGVQQLSYCFVSYFLPNDTSTLFLGQAAKLTGSSATMSTPFLKNPPRFYPYYYLNLKNISIGATTANIPPSAFEFKADGTGGIIIDSGTTFTLLFDEVYQPVKAVLLLAVDNNVKAVPNPSRARFDLCFKFPADSTSVSMPNITFHFEGDADMVIPPENYLAPVSTDIWCVMIASISGGNIKTSILGNYMQQNMHILYDLEKELLSFEPAQCNQI